MNSNLLRAASTIIPNQQLLVNVISRRVKQLARGHRPLVAFVPGMGLADVALTEVIEAKLTFELAPEDPAKPDDEKVVAFPAVASRKAA